MKALNILLTTAGASLISGTSLAVTILVGPSRPYATLQQVASILQPGDTVLVDGGAVYPGGVAFSRAGTPQARILVRGVQASGSRPVIDGGTNAVAFIDGANHYTFEGFEVRNATFRGIYHQSRDLIIRDVIVHHCRNGLMGADNGSGSLLLEFSEFYENGQGTTAHQIYMATDEATNPGSVFRMQFCWVHDGTGGNNVKSRAERNEIYYNRVEGAVYHELELIGPDPAGGVPADLKREDSDVVGNVLWKKSTPSGGQLNFYVVRFGGDGTGQTFGRYRFVNNTVIMGSSAVFRLFDGIESAEMHNNVFHRPGGGAAPLVRTAEAVWSAGEVIAGQHNWVHADLTGIPSQWTGTLTGTDPQFNDLSVGDLLPAAGSPLIGAGIPDPQSPPGYPFPAPLFPPAFQPPGSDSPPGPALARAADGALDVGAYERAQPLGVGAAAELPANTDLEQNYPNPYNPSTRIRWRIAVGGRVDLRVFDILGREVATLAGEWQEPGTYAVDFDASALSSGVYLYRLEAGSVARTKLMTLVR